MGKENNKKDLHIKVCLTEGVEAPVSHGLEKIMLKPGFPDFAFSEIDTSSQFLGKKLSVPLIIAPLTGGGKFSRRINNNLARAAEILKIGMSVGSQKLMLDGKSTPASYLVREMAPSVPLLANLGVVHVRRGLDYLKKAVELIGADGLSLYINPLQEVLQEKGECDFTGLWTMLEELAENFPYPLILKEVGFGMAPSLLKWAGEKRNISGVDVAGLGGTNWARIEGLLSRCNYSLYETWGIKTRDAIITGRAYLRKDQFLIASGGIRNGFDMAKAFALGADLVAMGLPFLRWASRSQEEIIRGVRTLEQELKVALWFTGSRTVKEIYGKFYWQEG